MYVEASITVCLSELVKVYFWKFTLKESEEESEKESKEESEDRKAIIKEVNLKIRQKETAE